MRVLNFYFSTSISDILRIFPNYRRANEYLAVSCDNGMAADYEALLIAVIFIPAVDRDIFNRDPRLV